jgi:hypothetical protein
MGSTVDSVFISSIQRDFGDVRQAVRRAAESLGLRALMAESAGASPSSPQRALLDLVHRADSFLLVLGPRYSKPTEDEFDEARRLGKPILVLRQSVEADADQEAFVERVAGGWKGGRLWGAFADANDVGFAAVQALTNLRDQAARTDLRPAAEQRARELALGARTGGVGHGSTARIAHVPLLAEPLLDAVALDRQGLGDRIAAIAREQSLVPQSVGLDPRISRAGIALHQAGRYANSDPLVAIGADGAVSGSFDVGGSDQFGGMRVDPQRLDDGVRAAGAFALAAWSILDEREAVQQVAVALAIPEAQHKVFGNSTGSSSLQMGSFGMPTEVVVPEPARIVRSADVSSAELAARLVAEVRRLFTDAGAVER